MTRTHLVMIAACAMVACSSDDEPRADNNRDGVGDMSTDGIADQGPRDDGGSNPADAGNNGSDMPVADMGATDTGESPDATSSPDTAPDMEPSGVHVGAGDPYATGALTVVASDVSSDPNGAPVDLTIYAPQEPGEYPVVVFQHGFSLRASYYSTLLEHVATHGFVVVAPQMYEPGFIGAPTAAEEAMDAEALYAWVSSSLDAEVAVDVRADLLGLVGHSRGAKVVWLVLENGFAEATAALGLDPVDGTGGPFGGEARVLDGGLMATLPSLFIGAELSANATFGMACAPDGDDHEAFYESAPAPSYWAFVEDYGHLDMLDDQTPGCGFTCSACDSGPDAAFRTFSAGQITAFFRWQLQGDATAEAYATGANGAPVTVQFMNK